MGRRRPAAAPYTTVKATAMSDTSKECERVVDHWISDLTTYALVPENRVEGEKYNHRNPVYLDDEFDNVFRGRVDVDGVEHFRFAWEDGSNEHVVPAWMVAYFEADGAQLGCTAWLNGIDPRSTAPNDPTMTHADPKGEIPIGGCPIHTW